LTRRKQETFPTKREKAGKEKKKRNYRIARISGYMIKILATVMDWIG
jgi:hypothetical protein